MNNHQWLEIENAREAAVKVLMNNMHGPCRGLPKTSAWGYYQPYTRDMMICSLGFLLSGRQELIDSLRQMLEVAARNQTSLGHITSLIHDPEDRGASDCTPLFLLGAGLYRQFTNQPDFISPAVQKALTWMMYQSPNDRVLVSQLPTSDWRDEQWVLGYGLFVNTILYACLRLFDHDGRAEQLLWEMNHFTINDHEKCGHVHEGLLLKRKPYYAMWSYKIFRSERFDLLGNSLAILTGMASLSRSRSILAWIEAECRALKEQNKLAVDLCPNLFPYIQPEDPDWQPRYDEFNRPGDYHNGGIWPFIAGFHIAALVAAGRMRMASRKLIALTELIKQKTHPKIEYGFNEWHNAFTGSPCGQDWQSWSAAMYIYAVECVKTGSTPFFDRIRIASGWKDVEKWLQRSIQHAVT
ncbi:Plant neutral invertase [Anaerohalosphaera lusitana]|uniref:beta-fructofuranosidase n=1 Tax=Anaerohalosphaera lusitana TaxID=1936003 RepID=A0A1U9NPB6_9BACT|nr:glycoside hydrolase 100 family protein [Anaerohalosphaera lusitana]AQT69558.1 Plant neutral invertase [Anaerohalosphaera lusitana]